MVKLKGKSDIGDKINTQIVAPIAKANRLEGVIDQTDFNDDEKLGSDKEKVNRLSNLVGIFQNDALDFADNRGKIEDEVEAVSRQLTRRLKELAARYARSVDEIDTDSRGPGSESEQAPAANGNESLNNGCHSERSQRVFLKSHYRMMSW